MADKRSAWVALAAIFVFVISLGLSRVQALSTAGWLGMPRILVAWLSLSGVLALAIAIVARFGYKRADSGESE